MNIHLENVNLNSTSGPNSFASKLVKYLPYHGVEIDYEKDPDAYICFIETHQRSLSKPMIQRLDGIYFNSAQNYRQQNNNIKRTYEMADGIIFQSDFNKELTFRYFGPHDNYKIIHNGADTQAISKVLPLPFERYESLWSCASSWRPHKRLHENIRYFLAHAGSNDGLMIAGDVPTDQRTLHKRIHYVGHLKQHQLYALYKRSKYFIHLAWLDHCPNVVVDARACGSQIICSSDGGTKEIAGLNAIVIKEDPWNFEPVELYKPPKLDFSKKSSNSYDPSCCMEKVSGVYHQFISEIL